MTLNTIIQGNCLEVMKTLPENSVDAIVSDPPAGISFMSKEWDDHKTLQGFQDFICQAFTEAIRVLKPGGHALVWAIPRTSHHTAMGLERSGFEIRDVITHIFGSGFPKSLNIGKAMDKIRGNKRKVVGKKEGTYADIRGKQHLHGDDIVKNRPRLEIFITKGTSEFEGLGTALKPASEHWILCRKPLSEKTIAENCLKWGTGGLSIDECRVGVSGSETHIGGWQDKMVGGKVVNGGVKQEVKNQGRFPANLILDCICDEVKEGKEFVSGSFPEERGETAFFGLNKKHSHRVGQVKEKTIIHTNPECPCYLLDRQSGRTGAFAPVKSGQKGFGGEIYGKYKQAGDDGATFYGDGLGGASRFFYQAKASRSERNMGCEGLEERAITDAKGNGLSRVCNVCGASQLKPCDCENNTWILPIKNKNNHPTVKPLALMEYLIKLVSREGQIVLDPFAGSGSTLIACKKIGRNFIGIEKETDYIRIAEARLKSLKIQNTLL